MSERRLWGWRTVLASTALLVAAAAVTVSAPTVDQVQDPIETRGAVGQRVQARTAEVQVHAVRAARAVAMPDGSVVRTPGVWVVLDVTVGCRLTSCGFAASELRSRGRGYLPAAIVPGVAFTNLGGSPGLRYRTTALFEVPRSVLGDRRADLVASTALIPSALDGVPVVRLAVPASAAASAAVRTATITGAS